MSNDLEQSLRGPDAYTLARSALAAMERHQVWPTPLNFEIWIHYAGSPGGPLGQEIDRLVAEGQPITERVAEELAAQFLPKAKLREEIRDTGDQLSRQLQNMMQAVQSARRTNADYGETLAGAATDLEGLNEPAALQALVSNLTAATRQVQTENTSLEKRLSKSTEEVNRLREHLEEVRREAMTDALTLLANRKAFDEALTKACADAERTGEPVTLAVIDIDHFKRFNDTWGHQTGDQVLRYVASVIGRLGKAPRVAARFGGEEFAVVIPAMPTKFVMGEFDRLRREIGSRALKRRSTNEDLGSVTVSIGLAELRSREAAAGLLERADAALYASKRAGRDRLTVSGEGEAAVGEKAA